MSEELKKNETEAEAEPDNLDVVSEADATSEGSELPHTQETENKQPKKKGVFSRFMDSLKESKAASFTALPAMSAVGGGGKQALGLLGNGFSFVKNMAGPIAVAAAIPLGLLAIGAAPLAIPLAIGFSCIAATSLVVANRANIGSAILNTNKSSHKFNQNLRERVPGKPVLNNLVAGVGYVLGAVASLVPVVNGMARGAMNQFNDSFDRHPPLSKAEKEEKKKQKKAKKLAKKNNGPKGDGQKQKQKPGNGPKPGAKPKVKSQGRDGQKAKVAPKDGPSSKPASDQAKPESMDRSYLTGDDAKTFYNGPTRQKERIEKEGAKAKRRLEKENAKKVDAFLKSKKPTEPAKPLSGDVLAGKKDAHTLGGSVVARTEYTKTDAGQAPIRRGFTPSKGMGR